MFAEGVVMGLSPQVDWCSLKEQGTLNSQGAIMQTSLLRFSGTGHPVSFRLLLDGFVSAPHGPHFLRGSSKPLSQGTSALSKSSRNCMQKRKADFVVDWC